MNIVIAESCWTSDDLKTIFDDEIDSVVVVADQDISQLMVMLGIYPSTSKARQAGRVGPIPKGYTEFKASKKVTLYIWNPDE